MSARDSIFLCLPEGSPLRAVFARRLLPEVRDALEARARRVEEMTAGRSGSCDLFGEIEAVAEDLRGSAEVLRRLWLLGGRGSEAERLKTYPAAFCAQRADSLADLVEAMVTQTQHSSRTGSLHLRDEEEQPLGTAMGTLDDDR